MPITVLCPNCQKKLTAPDAAAGKRAKCPHCGQVMQLPASAPQPPSAPASSGPASQAGGRTAAGEELPSLTDPMASLGFSTKPTPKPANPPSVLGGMNPLQFDEMMAEAGPRVHVDRPVEQERRPCPSCGELVVRGAAKCRYCGEDLDPVARARRFQREERRSRRGSDDDSLNVIEILLAIFCSGIACIVGIVYMIDGRPKGGKLIGLSLTVIAFLFVLRIVLALVIGVGLSLDQGR